MAENLAQLMYSVMMTGYMFRNAQYRMELQQSLAQAALPEAVSSNVTVSRTSSRIFSVWEVLSNYVVIKPWQILLHRTFNTKSCPLIDSHSSEVSYLCSQTQDMLLEPKRLE